MGYMIEITEDKFEEFGDCIENVMRYGSKAMHCLEKMKRERIGERMPDYRDSDRDRNDWRDDDRYDERRDGRRGWSRY